MARQSPLEGAVRKHLAVLRRALPGSAHGDVEALHRARVATRRLREVLPLLGEERKTVRQLRRTVRRLTKALGPGRTLDVALGNLQALERDPEAPRAAVTCIERVLTDERRSAQREIRKAITSSDLEELDRRVLRLARSSSGTSGRRLPLHTSDIWRRAGRRAERLRRTMAQAGVRFQPDRLHAVRIAVKKLRYALESATDIAGARPVQGAKRLEQAQELLGRIHDLQDLIAHVRRVQASSRGATRERPADFKGLARRLEGECRELHARYVEARPGLVMFCDRVERAAERRAGD